VTVFAQTVLVERLDNVNFDSLYSIRKSLEEFRAQLDIVQYRRWLSQELGIGCTPLQEVPEELNPYAKDSIQIFYKPEYLNRGGSGKARSVSFMLFYYKQLGLLNGIKKITTAGFGNFIRTLADILPYIAPEIVPHAYMGRELLRENKDLVEALINADVVLNGCEDNRCPTNDMERGKAITYAYVDEQVEPETVLFLDQHGVYKPEVGLLNAAGYYYSMASEIVNQLDTTTKFYYVNGEGTRGSLVGTAVRLKTMRPNTEVIGLRQQEDGNIFGLRSLSQLGRSNSLGQAENLTNAIYKISDHEAYCTMTKLWDVDIPATPSGGSYIAGALRKAAELKKENKEGIIVTLLFDSIDYYRNILGIWLPQVLGKALNFETFETLRTIAFNERTTHIKKLIAGENELFRDFLIRECG